jgi:hypothetical protein
MELVSLTIRGTVITSRYGVLSSGDVLRTDADYARHLVEDCKAADYNYGAPAAAHEPATAPQTQPQTKQRKQREPRG